MFGKCFRKFSYILLCVFSPCIASAQVFFDKKITEKKLQPTCVAYSHDSKLIASGGISDDIVVCSTTDASNKKYLKGLSDFPISIAFTPDNRYILSGGKDERVTLWLLSTQKIIYSIKSHKGTVRGIAVSPDGELFASCGDDNTIKLCKVSSGKVIKVLTGHTQEVQSVNFSPDGSKLLSASFDKTIREWDVETGEPLSVLQGHTDKVRYATYSPSGNQIASCGDDKTIRIWENKELVNSIRVHKAIVQTVAFSPDGKYIASGAHDKLVAVVNVEKGNIVYVSSKMDNYVLSIAFSPNGKNLASVSLYSDDINVWNVDGLKNYQNRIASNEKSDETKPVNQNLTASSITPPKAEKKSQNSNVTTNIAFSDVQDLNIASLEPLNPNEYRYAYIIGNEDYSSFQAGLNKQANVDFAENDARAFREYAIKILGVPEANIELKINARAMEMKRILRVISGICEATNGKAEIYFYYAGHGLPDENTKKPFLIPVDVGGTDDLKDGGIALNDLYTSLTKFPTKKATVFLDACFSGGGRNEGLVQSRGFKVAPKEDAINGSVVVFASSSGNQSSLPYKEKTHGLFTYFLLKKLKETKGEITYNDLGDYLKEQVGLKSVIVNNKKQNPQVNFSSTSGEASKNWTFR